MEKGDVRQRLEQFIKYLGISIREFERSVGVSNGYVKGMTTGAGAERLRQISRMYPTLNTDWLMTGEGEMLLPTCSTSVVQNVEQNNSHGNIVTATLNETNKFLDLLMEKEKSLERAQAHLSTAQEQITQLINLLAK